MAETKEPDYISQLLQKNYALVVDSTSSSRTSLIGTLTQLGVKRNMILTAASFEDARNEIAQKKPALVLSDFNLGKQSGLDLVDEFKNMDGGPKYKFFVLVTGNASQSTVARAAEEDVDTFVIKPYNLKTFRKALNDAIASKVQPSEYMMKINAGKDYLERGEMDQAQKLFEDAKKLSDLPTLACFYLGQVELIKQAFEDASEDYREGLTYNRIHYKCLIGLYELLMKAKKYEAAYDVVKKLAQYFPANPKRLTGIFRLAILTSNFDDVESYYRIFTLLDERPDELIRYTCSALAITGKYYLSQSTRSRAFDLFDRLAISCAGRYQYMRHAVETMIQFEQTKEATEYLKRFPAEARGKPDYLISTLIVASITRPVGEVLQMARQLVQAGVQSPPVYVILIKSSVLAGFNDTAQNVVDECVRRWPDKAADFTTALAATA